MIIINDNTPISVLNSIRIGDTITNDQNITGKVFAMHHGENAGVFKYVFYFNTGRNNLTEYAITNRELNVCNG